MVPDQLTVLNHINYYIIYSFDINILDIIDICAAFDVLMY